MKAITETRHIAEEPAKYPTINTTKDPMKTPVTAYHEEMLSGTLYRITSIHHNRVDLGKTLEQLTVRKILQMENDALQSSTMQTATAW